MLIKKDKIDTFDKKLSPLDGETIAVRVNTTTSSLIRYIYTSSKIEELTSRAAILNSLKDDKEQVSAYATDEILLRAFYEEYKGKLESYVIRPKESLLSYEKYGIIVYDVNKPELLKNINEWIKSKRGFDACNAMLNKVEEELLNKVENDKLGKISPETHCIKS